MQKLIVLDGLSKRFGSLTAVDNVLFAVEKGQVLGFLGPNGAGKSTTMKMIAGFLEPTSGSAEIAGYDIATSSVEARKKIGYLPEGAPTYGDMTPASFLDFIAEIRGFDGTEKFRRVASVVEKVRLLEVLHQPIDTLSKGYKRRVGLAQALVHDPDVLILDEPTDGLDPNQKHHVRSLIREMSSDKAIIVSTHILEEVEAVCSRAIIIASGVIVADGTPEELLARDADHNAIMISVESSHAAEVEARLQEFGPVERVRRADSEMDEILLRINGDNDAAHIGRIHESICEHKLKVNQVYLGKGTLDEVFRQITTINPMQETIDA
jgi:ABC-2 type transport system ATP-binding protein